MGQETQDSGTDLSEIGGLGGLEFRTLAGLHQEAKEALRILTPAKNKIPKMSEEKILRLQGVLSRLRKYVKELGDVVIVPGTRHRILVGKR